MPTAAKARVRTSATGRHGMTPGISKRAVAAGFTLVELIVVIVLMGVMAAMIVPEMRGTYGDERLRAGGRELLNVCALASSRAVSFNAVHRVHVDSASRKFRMERRTRTADRGLAFVPVRGVAGCEGQLGEHITVRIRAAEEAPETDSGPEAGAAAADVANANANAGSDLPFGETGEAGPGTATSAAGPGDVERGPPQSVSFYPDGTADRAEIELKDVDGYGLVLRVNPVTSRVRVLERRRP